MVRRVSNGGQGGILRGSSGFSGMAVRVVVCSLSARRKGGKSHGRRKRVYHN